MDFVAVMIFTWSLYKVFQLECLMLLIIEITFSNQITAWSCLSKLFYKKACNVASQSSKKEERTLAHKLIFAFIWNFTGEFLSKNSDQKQEGEGGGGGFRRDKKKGWSYSRGGGGVYRRGIKTSAHYAPKCFKIKLSDKSWI